MERRRLKNYIEVKRKTVGGGKGEEDIYRVAQKSKPL